MEYALTASAVLFISLVLTCCASGQQYHDQQPAVGPWKGEMPGSYVLTKHTTCDGADTPPRTEYERELLLGVDDHQKPWFATYRSSLSTGPWQYGGAYGSGRTYADSPGAVVKPAGERTFKIGGRGIACIGTHIEVTDDASIHTGEQWIDRASGVEIESSWTTRPRDADAPRSEHTTDLKTISVEQRTINGHTCEAFVQQTTEATNGVVRATYRSVVSPAVPGQRIALARWNGAHISGPAKMEIELISWGTDPEALAERRKQSMPSMESAEQQLRRFHEQTLADAQSPDLERRARGLSTLAMNQFPAELRQQIEQAIRAGLADADINVHRAAAEAAGFQQVPGTAQRIVELAKADPQGVAPYLRALGRLGDPVGLDLLLAAAKDDRGIIGDLSAGALANFDDDRATQALKERLANPKWTTRGTVVRALGQGKSPRSVELLLSVANDENAMVRSGVMLALLEKADPRGLSQAIKSLKDPSPNVQSSAAMAVARLSQASSDPRPAADALVPLLDKQVSVPTRVSAALGLAQMKDPRVLPTLKELAARSPDEEIPGMFGPASFVAIRALTIMGTPEALAALGELARDPQHTALTLNALRDAKSPQAARVAWELYRQSPVPSATVPSTKPATTRTMTPQMRAETDNRWQMLSIVIQQADQALRDAIVASIPASPVGQRPELRRIIRQIDDRLATQAQTVPGK